MQAFEYLELAGSLCRPSKSRPPNGPGDLPQPIANECAMTNYPDIELYIDGRWKRASGVPVINPAEESVLGTVPKEPIGS